MIKEVIKVLLIKINQKTYYNSPNKWLVTTGASLKDSNRPLQVMPETNRQYFNKQELGIAAPVNNESMNNALLSKFLLINNYVLILVLI